jgi:hypothetical protein
MESGHSRDTSRLGVSRKNIILDDVGETIPGTYLPGSLYLVVCDDREIFSFALRRAMVLSRKARKRV